LYPDRSTSGERLLAVGGASSRRRTAGGHFTAPANRRQFLDCAG